ncbi:MAG: hypothetical protein V7688_09490 [Alcanivorax jadensis]|uniref:hypothetical protein n=1 Tax=Alcanivorax jadensis TaxID=64988 RepID=UPI0030037332
MARFKIERPVKVDGEIQKDGEITLDPKIAAPLVKSGSLTPLGGDAPNPGVGDAVTFAEAIAKLDPNNPDHWMKSNGAPDLKALEKTGGLKLKAADRDSLWAEHLKAQEVEGYWVRSKEGTVEWRAQQIDEDGVGFALDVLTEEQLAELQSREDLVIEQGTFAGIASA